MKGDGAGPVAAVLHLRLKMGCWLVEGSLEVA